LDGHIFSFRHLKNIIIYGHFLSGNLSERKTIKHFVDFHQHNE
jgi:hypothetical protein